MGAAAAMEGNYCFQGKQDCTTWHGLSEQNMVDCASYNSTLGVYDNHGCNGGEQSNAIRWAFMNNGIASEDDYPYTATQNTCQTDNTPAAQVSTDICGTTSYNGPDAELLKQAL